MGSVSLSRQPSPARPRARSELLNQPAEQLETEVIELAGRLSVGTTEDNISDLLDIAGRTSAGRLRAAVAAWSQRNDDPETIRRRQCEARSVTWRTEPDGMVVVAARLTPEAAGGVCAVVDTVVARNDAPAGASLPQQRADVLVGVATGGGGGAVTAEVVVHVREDGNALVDGTPLSDHAVAGMLPEAFVSLLMYDWQRQWRRRVAARTSVTAGSLSLSLGRD